MRLVILLALSSCAELRSGWVKVDFLEQCEYCVCQMKIAEESTAQCVSLDSVEKEMTRKRASEQGDL